MSIESFLKYTVESLYSNVHTALSTACRPNSSARVMFQVSEVSEGDVSFY